MKKISKKKKEKLKFPKGFFTKERPEISAKEALKDIVPIDWKNNKKAT